MELKNLSLLLSIHEAIATIHEKNQLFEVIFEKLKDVLEFELAGIQILNKSKTFFEIFMQGYYSSEDEPLIKDFWREKLPASENPFHLTNEEPYIQIVGEEGIKKAIDILKPNPGLTSVLEKHSISYLINLPIMLDNELFGSVLFATKVEPVFSDDDHELLLSLSKPLAIAVKNTLIYEDMMQNEREKDMLLHFTNLLITVKNRDQLLMLMASEIENQKEFLYVAINAKGGGKNIPITACYLIDEEKKIKNFPIDENKDIPILTLKSKLNTIKGSQYAEFNHDDFAKLCDISSHFRALRDDLGFASLLFTSYGHDDEEVNLILGLKNPSGFLEREILSITGLMPQLAMIFKNFFAYEEIDFLRKKLEDEKHYLIDEINLSADFQEMIGISLEMQDVKNKIKQVAELDVTVLIEGETGTGKELIAHAVHNLSQRKEGPFIKVNCAALPSQLIESELFGHEKGSFTGAIERRIGKFELADGGTIFLDEIGELPLELQAKFLRVLQEHEFERIGGQSTVRTNIRIIDATNRNLK